MLLGIPLHAASFFSPTVSFIQASGASSAFDFGGGLIHAFRMAAFYCVAGFFAGMLLARRQPLEWWTGRIVRLAYLWRWALCCSARFTSISKLWPPRSGHGSSVADEFTRLLAAPVYWRWFHHLWFLVPLLWMCSIAAALHALFPALSSWRLPERVEQIVTTRFVAATLGLAAAIGLYRYATNWTFHYLHVHEQPVLTSIAYVSDLALFLPFFASGALLSRAEKLLDRFSRPAPALWIVGIAATIAYAAFNARHEQPVATIMLRALSGICVTHIFISAARQWFNRASPLVDQAVAASFGIYMLHYPLIAAMGLH